MAAAVVAALGPSRAYADPTPAELDNQVATAWQQLESVVEHYNTTRESLNSTRGQLATTDAELAPLNQQIQDLQAKVSVIASGMYKSNREGPTSALLNAASPGMLLDQLTMLDHVARDKQNNIRALQVATNRYEADRRRLKDLEKQQSAQDRELTVAKAVIESNLNELQSLRTKVYGAQSNRSLTRDTYVPVFPNDPGGTALRFAYQQIGKWYQWAAAGPNSYDCSGLVLAAWHQAGKELPHSSALQWAKVQHIKRDDLRPGDLVFYYRDIHHVAIYAGNGKIINAPQSGERISMRDVDFAPVYGYGRVS